MTSPQYQRITVGALLIALLALALCWRWADQAYLAGARMRGYWIGVAGSALPAVVLAGCALWLWGARKRGRSAASISWLVPLLALCVAFLAFMLLFPLL